ncbi:hypothetical protein PVL29_017488 [Vitis rotundifolia]|uniref:Flavin-containing monooxygenase n=1 Tax=Vitis rotundifolia TaxID=103349 RepID=A0AA38ZBD4_VITRO|nr:hypothetical protein PVL29_017488 [Vitis rotundifolia]
MAKSARVAVIGAGVAGLAAARELHREGHRVVVLEKRHSLGGTWLYDSRVDSDPLGLDPARYVVGTSLYHSLRTNLPRQLMGFLDYPFAKRPHEDQRTFPGHEEVLRFLNEFADEFRCRELIRFCTGSSEWSEPREGTTRGCGEVHDAVVVCNGHFTEPQLAQVPDMTCIEKWRGYQIHSHNYRISEPFIDQVVVLIGLGPSAFDISREVVIVAKELHITTRAPNVTVGKSDNHENIWLHKMIEFVYEDGKVVFQDGSSVHADTIFYCTGYKYHFPFIETNGFVTIDDDNRVGPLYKHVFPPHLAPWLSFIGMPKQDTPFLTTELQSKWLAHVLSGKVLLPTEEEMMSDVENYYHHMEETGVPKSFTHVLPPNEIEYRNWLLAQVGMPPLKEWRGRMYRECVKFAKAKLDGYRDQWDDDYWDAVIASQNSKDMLQMVTIVSLLNVFTMYHLHISL